jgi:hypothetical protein
MRKTALSILVVVAILVAGTATLTSTATASSGSNATTLRLDVEFSPFNLVDIGKPGLSDGDQIVFHDKLTRNGRPAGDQLGSCVVVDAAVALANCTGVVRLPRGTVTVHFANSPPPMKTLGVTGGTGAYRTTRGDGTLVEKGDGTGTLTFRLTR